MTKSMRQRLVVALLIATVSSGLPATAAVPAADASAVPGQALVRFRPEASAGARTAALRTVGASIARTIPVIDVAVVRFAASLPVARAVERLRAQAAIEFAERDGIGSIAISPNDTCVTGCISGLRQWNIEAVNAEPAWDLVPGAFFTQATKRESTPIKVAVLDTKIDLARADWINAGAEPANAPYDAAVGGQIDMADATDFVPSGNQQGPAAYHGTFVAALIGAAANNQRDLAGLAYHAQIMPVTVVDGAGKVKDSDLASGIVHAWQRGARVINLSLGLDDYSQTVQNAIYSVTKPIDGRPGALVIAAAGNNANSGPFYPAQLKSVMAVSAIDAADRPGSCTNHFGEMSVGAPGAGILSLDPRSATGLSTVGCGTSTAAPHVSALAALLFTQDPFRTPKDVRDLIEQNADDANPKLFAGRDEYFGHGRINFHRSLVAGDRIMRGLAPLPVVDQVSATIPRAVSGTSQATATGKATAPKEILEAEWFLGRVGAPGTGGEVELADVAGDPNAKSLSATIVVPLEFRTGVHRLYVRARDADGWGPASSGVMIVDRTPPTVTDLSATMAIPLAGYPSTIKFHVGDDYSTSATYTYKVTRTLPGGTTTVYESTPRAVAIPGPVETTWMPQVTDAGPYNITVTVWDEAQNASSSVTSTIVL